MAAAPGAGPRRVAVVGAGVVGTCTAWFLRERGLEVTVFERRDAVAAETSAGNAGVIAPGYVTPWAAPGMPRKVLASLLAADSPVRLRPSADPALWRWMARWLRECEPGRYRVNKARMQRLAFRSREVLHALRARLSIDDGRREGYLQLLRTAREVAMTGPARAMLAEAGVRHRLLDASEARALEPSLSPDVPLTGALWLPDDESASCPAFARALAAHARAAGVSFAMGTEVRRIDVARGEVVGLTVRAGGATAPPARDVPLPFDAVVVAGACDALPLLRACGLRLPIVPVRGFSATLPMADASLGPRRALMDEAFKVAIVPFDGALRVAGTAMLGGDPRATDAAALRTLLRVGRDWFLRAADWTQAEAWVGARPMTPDGPPLLGATPVRGLFVNMGHGSTGWAMAAGAGEAVADAVAGLPPSIDLEGLAPDRLRR